MSYTGFLESQHRLQKRASAHAQALNLTNSSKKLNVAVVGAGIGALHVAAYQTLSDFFEVKVLCDLDTEKAQHLAAQHQIPNVTHDFNALCADETLDVIDICTPPHLHYAQASQALQAGKDVICEKPLVASLQDVDRLMALEHTTHKRLMPIFQYRFGHGLQQLKYLQNQELTGKPLIATVETHWQRGAEYFTTPWRGKWHTELGGVLVSQAIHAHDMFSYIMGPISRVFARCNTSVNAVEVEDCVSVSLELASGAIATLSATLGSAKEITQHRFYFEHISAESNASPYLNSCQPWRFHPASEGVKPAITQALDAHDPLPEGYIGQFYRFHQAITQGHALPVELADARASLELITAIYYAARHNQDVALPLYADHPLYHSWLPEHVERS